MCFKVEEDVFRFNAKAILVAFAGQKVELEGIDAVALLSDRQSFCHINLLQNVCQGHSR
jgi:hypothetical protein